MKYFQAQKEICQVISSYMKSKKFAFWKLSGIMNCLSQEVKALDIFTMKS